MAAPLGRDEIFWSAHLSLCLECSPGFDVDLALVNAEKAARVGLWVVEGMIRDTEGCCQIARRDLEIVRQLMVTVDAMARRAADAYWATREAPEGGDDDPPGGNVVALPPRPCA